ncbi:class I SAM-dependent methyltransferase [Salinirubellus sp. GCM10025818]|uniref:class I SAM-dependent methyltransferase n=1 Tax=Salinirubellus TaxID=2162630 RepID=UPI0030D1D8A3
MRPLALDDLPEHSAWARYLLDPAGDPPADPDAYTDIGTYDDIYSYLLGEFRSGDRSPEAFVRRIYAEGREDPGPISIRDDLFLASPAELLELERFAVADALGGVAVEPATVLDLGCGWGSALGTVADVFPDATVIGGEYSRHGVELARALGVTEGRNGRVSVRQFDLRDEEWDLLDGRSEVLVFTRGTLTTLPDVERVVDRLARLASEGRVVGGVHLEQVDRHPGTTLGLLRRHYGRVRGYDGAVLAELERRGGVEVDRVVYDQLGPNPLHPRTLVRWRPA